MNQPIQCTEEDLQELKRLALAVRAVSNDDDALGVALDEYDEHANPDQVLVLFTKIDELTGKVGNMVCAKRQMDEELEIARDDLLIFKSAVSAIGEASKKLVVCARTTGGTAGPDQGLMDACAGVEGVITLGGIARAVNEFERLTAERDALQQRLTAADERADELETGIKWETERNALLLASLTEAEDMLSVTSLEAGQRIEVLEGLLLQTNELFYAIQDELGAVTASAVEVMRGKVFTALKPAHGLDRRDMAAKVHLMKREGGGDEN